MTTTGDPYARFLATADVATWAECLDRATRAVAASTPDDERHAEALARALCMAIYLEWLARVSGDLATAERASRHVDDFQDLVVRAGVRTTPGWRRCWALLLFRKGCPAHAAELLGEVGRGSPELAVLLGRRQDVANLVALRGFVRGSQPTTFLPAVFEYARALVNVGAVHEAQQLIEAGGWDEDEPLLLEIRASIDERLGQWPAAFGAYRRSPWPAHRYRAAVVGTIIGQWQGTGELEFDGPMRQVLFQVDGDLDQAEMARCVAFLNACLWQPVVSWMLELELGKLSFRRRQFAEADVHLLRALSNAPRDARHAIAELRFTNLTWLTGNQTHARLSMQPEALVAGHEALRLGGDAAATATVRVWMAERTGDLGLIPASLETWTPYDRATAFVAVGHTGGAIDCWLESLSTRYYHRAAEGLIRHLHAAGLTRAVARLADIVLLESTDDFLALWETCRTLQDLLATELGTGDDDAGAAAVGGDDGGADDAGDDLHQLAARYRERLIELSQFEFMNAVRTQEVVQQAGYEDLAEELLLRAAKQAEGVSELVTVAVLRRTGLSRSVHSDQEALWCLARARRVARDRLERLEIAREFFHYGAVRDGRVILQEEGVLSAETPLSHSEMIVALQCAPWCTPEERADLAGRAGRRLNQDVEAGGLGPYPSTYGSRLLETLHSTVEPPMVAGVRGSLDSRLTASLEDKPWTGDHADEWPAIRGRVEAALTAADEQADDVVAALLDDVRGTASFGLRVLLSADLRTRLEELQAEARRVTPTVPAQRTPVTKAYDNGEGARTIELCDLWRSRITGAGADEAGEAAELRQFFETEQALLDDWEESRQKARAPVLRHVVRVAGALRWSLETLLAPDQTGQAHPVLRSVFEEAELDVHQLAAEATEQVRSAQRQLAAAAADHDLPTTR